MTSGKGINWPVLMRAGLNGLGMTPDAFWGLTPAELQLMIGPSHAQVPLLNDGLAQLMAAYPDEKRGNCDAG